MIEVALSELPALALQPGQPPCLALKQCDYIVYLIQFKVYQFNLCIPASVALCYIMACFVYPLVDEVYIPYVCMAPDHVCSSSQQMNDRYTERTSVTVQQDHIKWG